MIAEMQFNGRSVVVTGAASGIGRAAVEVFAELGAIIYAVDQNETGLMGLQASLGDVCRPVVADVSLEASAEKLHGRIRDDGVVLKALVNNVGVNKVMLVEDMSLLQWNELLAINLSSAFLLSKALMPLLLSSGSGAIVNVSSGYALIGGPRMPAYSASKAGLIGLTRQLSVDYGARGLRVNAVCPGLTLTERVRGYVNKGLVDSSDVSKRVLSGRFAQPREIANVIAFLSTDAASYVNGAIVPADGGQTAS